MTDTYTPKVGDKVRHVKTFFVGEVADISDFEKDKSCVVKFLDDLGIEQIQHWYSNVMELLDEVEYELVRDIVSAKRLKTRLNKEIAEAQTAYGKAEEAMRMHFERRAVMGTKRYAGFGQVSIDGVDVYPSIPEEDKEKAFQEIEEMGRGEIIKRSIHHSTLESFVNELLDAGAKVPEHVKYFTKPKLSFAKKK